MNPLTSSLLISRLFVGLIVNLLLAAGAYWKKKVSPSGAVTGMVLGTVIFLGGGFYFWLHLGLFFLSSTLIGRLTSPAKQSATQQHTKDDRRDGLQVLSNVGPGALAALVYLFVPAPAVLVAFSASFAAANADTWAGEIGMLSSAPPVSIITGKALESGTSGGVSRLGFLASFAGSALIGGLFWLGLVIGRGFSPISLLWAAIIAAAGFLGSVVDSMLGATVQAGYMSAVTGRHTEHPASGGRTNVLVKGVAVIDNDLVNLLSVIAAAILAGGAATLT